MKWLFNDGAFFILSKRKEGEKVGGALAKKKDCDTSKKKSHQLCLSSLFNLNGNGNEFNKKVKHSYNIKELNSQIENPRKKKPEKNQIGTFLLQYAGNTNSFIKVRGRITYRQPPKKLA